MPSAPTVFGLPGWLNTLKKSAAIRRLRSSNAVLLSADERTLFVANGGNNAVAVVDVSKSPAAVRGFIPAGWYPDALALAGRKLAIAPSDNLPCDRLAILPPLNHRNHSESQVLDLAGHFFGGGAFSRLPAGAPVFAHETSVSISRCVSDGLFEKWPMPGSANQGGILRLLATAAMAGARGCA